MRSNNFLMKGIRKVRFEWDLKKAPPQSPALPAKHEIKELKEYDVEAIWEGLQKAFLNEKSWIIGLDGHLEELRRRRFSEGKPVAAICAGPLVLEDAGLLEGKRFTAHFSAVNELPGAQIGERVIEDGLIITSRGAGTALEFGLALVDRLCGEAKEEEIARAIMA